MINQKKKMLSAVLAASMLPLGTGFAVFAEENDFVTFKMSEIGANAVIFADEAKTAEISNLIKNSEDGDGTKDVSKEISSLYPSKKISAGSKFPIKAVGLLNSEAVEGVKEANGGYIYSVVMPEYDVNDKIPFDVSTAVDSQNGILIGMPNLTEQTLNLTAGEYMSKLYVLNVSELGKQDVDIKITYEDGTAEIKTEKFLNINYNKPNDTDDKGNLKLPKGIWTDNISWKYRFDYTNGLIKEQSVSEGETKYYVKDAARRASVKEIDVDFTKKIKMVSFTSTDNYGYSAIIGITGKKISDKEIIELLAAGLPESATEDNAGEVKAVIDEIKSKNGWEGLANDDITAKIAKLEKDLVKVYRTYLTFNMQASGANAKIFGTSETAETIAAELSQKSASDVISDEILNNYSTKLLDANHRILRILNMLNKDSFEKIRENDGYIYDMNDKLPFDITTTDQNNGIIVGGSHTDYQTLTLNASEPVKNLYIYGLPIAGANLNTKIEYANGKETETTVSIQAAQWNTAALSDSYLWGDKISAMINFKYVDGLYTSYSNDADRHTCIAVIPTDTDSTVKSISFKLADQWNSAAIIGITGQTATTEEKVLSLMENLKNSEVNEQSYNKVAELIEAIRNIENSELVLSQEDNALINEKEKLSQIYEDLCVQEYVTFDISKGANGRAFVKNNTLTEDVKAEDMAYVNDRPTPVLNKDAFDGKKDSKGYIYADNAIPFDVNTDGFYGEGANESKKSGYTVGNRTEREITIDIPDGSYDSISVLAAAGYQVSDSQFYIEAVYSDGTVSKRIAGLSSPTYNDTFDIKNADSKVMFDAQTAPTLRNSEDPSKYTEFQVKYNFPVLTLDTDITKTITEIRAANNSSNVGVVVLAVTGSVKDSGNKLLTKLTNTENNAFTAEEINYGYELINDLSNKGIKNLNEYSRIIELKALSEGSEVKLTDLAVTDGILSGNVEVYSLEKKSYHAVCGVYDADGKIKHVYDLANDASSIGKYEISQAIEVSDTDTVKCFVWDGMQSMIPYTEAISAE